VKTLTKSDFRTLGLATLGGALELYDFIIFVFFANQIGQLFFPAEIPDWLRQSQMFGLFAVGYFVRPLSGTIMGHFGDLIGRKRIFTFSSDPLHRDLALLQYLCNLWCWIDPTDCDDRCCERSFRCGSLRRRSFLGWLRYWPLPVEEQNPRHASCGPLLFEIISNTAESHIYVAILITDLMQFGSDPGRMPLRLSLR
jgi:hypothetical protein